MRAGAESYGPRSEPGGRVTISPHPGLGARDLETREIAARKPPVGWAPPTANNLRTKNNTGSRAPLGNFAQANLRLPKWQILESFCRVRQGRRTRRFHGHYVSFALGDT